MRSRQKIINYLQLLLCQIETFSPQTVSQILNPPGGFKTNTPIEISISCRNLANKDVLSKSDPQCIVYYKPVTAIGWDVLVRTEVIQNNLNPDFATKVTLMYKRDEVQPLRFEIHDIDDPDSELQAQDFIGFVECTVGDIVTAGSDGYEQSLDCPEDATTVSDTGTIILLAEELASSKDQVFLEIVGSSVGSCLTGCLVPKSFFTISKSNESGNYVVVYRGKEVRGSNPHWPSVTVSEQKICNGDRDRQLKIEIFQRSCKGEEVLVGSHFTSIKRMTLDKNKDSRILLDGKNGKVTKTAITILCEIFCNAP